MFLHGQGELALGSRLKAVSESLYAAANVAYRETGHDLDAHWFPVLRYLQVRGPASVTEIAAAIGQTHPAVSQLAAKLRAQGWITRRADRSDARRGVLELSADAERKLDRLGPVWCAIRRAAAAAAARGGGTLLDALGAFEADIASGRLAADIRSHHARLKKAKIDIAPYRSDWAPHFERLNVEWLQRWFTLEDVDRAVLGDPQTHVIEPGGAILFATLDGEVIGTCALLKEAPGVYELSKMAVESGFRGFGAGRRLLDGVIAEFERRRGRTLFLESSKRLGPALQLYESGGFVHHPAPRPGSHYQRADVYMVYEPGKTAGRRAKAAPRKHLRVVGR
ncbi:DNA-binding MarR family transcriptional regulator/GNAT superfamily N-acetyltransferase [Dokdonella fugitiva]|uniref:DNA-binding MarR family transcriptional regulator/GNAT superfamily N-acetyltransferase n=1 Tax=Dokdonella fugitiva TaxID=328517 RepID=A0A839F084_9GAMM|nr:bifunctional helix-turn-helix transcriptional regulator/GNAT family N-acetyltransferase [Dokdonella fugitiva]MBA8889475.1 DNA-binding MarR family transcriptional regulator/GNAT superfamily N-acetyltransferase [Dokdonella fugitiva]